MNMLHKAFAAALGAGVLLVGAGLAPIEREGDAEHQAALKEIETQPFDAAHFERLDSWTHDRPLDASIIDSKVVLLAVVSVNDPQSLLTFTTLKRYERDRGDDGLIVLAVHPESGWESVAEKVSAGRIDVQLARDVGGEFARAVRADGYPDLFLIDRAGQLRYADIENRSLKEAVNQLLGESPEEAIANARNQAQGIEPGGSEQDPEQSGASQDRAGVGGEDAETAPGVLTMPETEVPASEYAATEWPEPNPRDIFAKNFQGRRLPAPLGKGELLTDPVSLAGKVVVLYFWTTDCSYCDKKARELHGLQKAFGEKLAVIGVSGIGESKAVIEEYLAENPRNYTQLFDSERTLYRALGVEELPHAVILSTDGIIRWQGPPVQRNFRFKLLDILEVDPMTKD